MKVIIAITISLIFYAVLMGMIIGGYFNTPTP